MTDSETKILIIGAFGQLGTELTRSLAQKYGAHRIVAADIQPRETNVATEELDVLDKKRLIELVEKHNVGQIYQLAAILSANGEKQPQLAWDVNMNGLINVLDVAVQTGIQKLFWPSSIAVFGPNSPNDNAPQICVKDPTSMYGITKLAGERLCDYYFSRYNLDVRSLRYPGIIGYQSAPGGGTTDYAVHIFHEARKNNRYKCFLRPDTTLPMIYMEDAIRATLELMEAPAEKVTIHSSYNLAGCSFDPAQLVAEIQKHLPGFVCEYEPDFRQTIADSWPNSIDDSKATADWGWKPAFDMAAIVKDMLANIV